MPHYYPRSSEFGRVMNTRSLALLAAALALGVLAAFVVTQAAPWFHRPVAGAWLTTDVALLMIGVAITISGLWRLWALRGAADFRWPIWLAMGAFVLYAEAFDVVPVKQLACRVFLTPRHSNTSPMCDRLQVRGGA